MRIAVSACLLGEKCKYNGGDNRNQAVLDYVAGHEVIPVCPERRCGMPAPRPRVEILNGRLVDEFGADVDALYRRGVTDTLAELGDAPVDLAILQPRSPTCGVHQVYDGTFTGVRLEGRGVLAQALVERGIPLKEPQEL